MITLTLTKKTTDNGRLSLDIDTNLQAKDVEVVVVINEKTESRKYDFSDLAGKLEWNGDGLAEQKRLRAEWD